MDTGKDRTQSEANSGRRGLGRWAAGVVLVAGLSASGCADAQFGGGYGYQGSQNCAAGHRNPCR